MNGNDAIVLAFALTNALRLLSYAPQIWRVARDRTGAHAISCLTWNLWIAANATTALYAWTHLHDLMLTVVNAGNAVCCASVVLITLFKRSSHARAATAPTPPPLEIAMTSNPRPNTDKLSLPRASAGVLAASIAAAAIVGLLTLMQSAPLGVQTAAPVLALSADSAPLSDTAEPLDASVDWSRIERAPGPDGASIAAYER